MTPTSAADLLMERFDAVERFLAAAQRHVAEEPLAPAQALVARAAARLRLSGDHTGVALAGATGTGKSSLFNRFAGLDRSPVGPLRPTTGDAYACVWSPAGAEGLLDWLGLASSRRFVRESALDADDEYALHGLVLLDLPDL